jgi:hypothetical protein
MFDEETANLLNYATLVISDSEINQELLIHRGKQFERVIWPISLALIVSYAFSLYSVYFENTGHPIWTITGGLDMVLIAGLWILVKVGKAGYTSYLTVPFFVYHSAAVVCVYNEWLPQYLLNYSKEEMANSILLCFVMVNAVPLVDFKYTLFVMFPVLMASTH